MSKVKEELKSGYKVSRPDLSRNLSNDLIENLVDLVYRLKIAGDLLYSAKASDQLLPKYDVFAREVLGEADESISNLERIGIISIDD